jgi:hypothetical protein
MALVACLTPNHVSLAHATFMEAKAASKKAIDISKEAIANASEEQRERYKAMEAVSLTSWVCPSLLTALLGWYGG